MAAGIVAEAAVGIVAGTVAEAVVGTIVIVRTFVVAEVDRPCSFEEVVVNTPFVVAASTVEVASAAVTLHIEAVAFVTAEEEASLAAAGGMRCRTWACLRLGAGSHRSQLGPRGQSVRTVSCRKVH